MSNLSTAKSALQAEIAHVQAGLAYYQGLFETLNDALHQLDAIEDEEKAGPEQAPKKQRGRPRKAQSSRGRKEKSAHTQRRGRPKAGSSDNRLPSTGGDFFLRLLSDRGQTAPQLLEAATGQLSFKPNAEEVKQLRARMISALMAMMKAGKVRSEGERRQRTYFMA